MRKTATKTAALISALLMLTVLTACGGGGAVGASGSTTLVLAQSVPPKPWDLAKASINYEATYVQPVFDTLVRLDTNGTPTPNLATSWSFDAPETTLTMKLRAGVKFTDGSPLTAQVVKDNLLHTKSGTDSAANAIRDIKDVVVVDPETVAIKLAYPSSSLLPALGQVSGMIAAGNAIKDPQTPVGSGPYKLDTTATTVNQQYTYVRNPDYWNAQAFPYDQIVIKYIPDQAARTNALMSGQVNGMLVPTSKISAVKGAGLTTVTFQPGDVEGLYIWDRAGKQVPALGNVKVRQALNYAFDRQALVKNVKAGVGSPTTQLFAPAEEAYDPALDQKYGYDPAKARQLLAEAGYPEGFAVTMPDLSAQFPQEQAALTQALQDIGIKVTLENLPANQIFPAILSGKYPMSYFKLGNPTSWDKIQVELMKDSTWNPLKYDDPYSSELIARIQSSTGQARTDLMKQLNAYTVEQAWNAPWNVIANTYATTRDVKVAPQYGFGYPPIYNFAPAK